MKKILVVDDERDALEVLDWFLQDWGYEVQTAAAGRDAVELGRRFDPDLLLTDYFLSDDLNGIDVIRELRTTKPNLSAVLVTGMRTENFSREIGNMGNISLVFKPFSWEELRSTLSNAASSA